MTSGLDTIIAEANTAFCHAANKVEHMLGQALQLDVAHTMHITIAQEVAGALARSVTPMALSAGVELQEHLDPTFSKVISMPAWTNIHPDDPCCKNSPLYPLTIGYGQLVPASPTTGPSSKARGKQKVVLKEEPEDCGHQLECSKCSCPRAMSTSTAPKAKCQCTKSKSKAIITSDDDLELDNVTLVAPQPMPPPAKPLKGVLKRTRKIIPNPVSQKGASNLEIDELEEPMSAGPAPRMGSPYVEIPSTTQLICCQGYNASNELLLVCTWCHCTKHKCSGKGSAATTKKRPAARSKSRHRESAVNVTNITDDEASSTGNVATVTITAAIPVATAAAASSTVIPVTTPTPTTTPAAVHVPAPDIQTVLVLKEAACQPCGHPAAVDPTAAEFLAADALPVVIRTDAAETLAAATQQDELLAVVTTMNVNQLVPPQVASAVMEQESASIASTAHDHFVYYFVPGMINACGAYDYHILHWGQLPCWNKMSSLSAATLKSAANLCGMSGITFPEGCYIDASIFSSIPGYTGQCQYTTTGAFPTSFAKPIFC
ncbi:hypothetical protein BD769DRAFT_1390525 [Suillus cothurnatus]|nr:hypothetical protein BD769DRAFT_1390525 [Suillus cothurnatus]